jgi:hypothetical protein
MALTGEIEIPGTVEDPDHFLLITGALRMCFTALLKASLAFQQPSYYPDTYARGYDSPLARRIR